MGRAHTISLRTRVSTIQQRALVSYVAPQIRSRQSLDLSFTALFDSSKDKRTFSARRWEGSTQIAQRWTRSRSLFYRFAYRRVSISTLKISNLLIPLLSQAVRVGVFSVGYVDDRRDDPVDSHRGTYNSLDLGLASKIFASETDYFRLLGRNSTYHRLGSKLVLARTLSFGMMTTLRTPPGLLPGAPNQDIPLPERFFSGGASSHRAFPENQAGPRDIGTGFPDLGTGFPLGGKALLIFSTELRFPLFGQNIGGVLFHDAGNVYSSLQDISFRFRQRDKTDFNYMVHAAGFGVRYKTPIGPVRLDFSLSPNSPRFSGCNGTLSQWLTYPNGCPVEQITDQRINRFQFHFSLGQTF
jgi:outer membrane translocation and assembly module TamA